MKAGASRLPVVVRSGLVKTQSQLLPRFYHFSKNHREYVDQNRLVELK